MADTLLIDDGSQEITNKTINGSSNTVSNIAVSSLANGTDGELITWDATGAPATVSVGTSGQVLTSNGVGAAPTFQDAAGGGGTWTLIGDAELSSASATLIDATSISTDYDVFRITFFGLSAGANTIVRLRFNNDTADNYDTEYILGEATTPSAGDVVEADCVRLDSERDFTSGEYLAGDITVHKPLTTTEAVVNASLIHSDGTLGSGLLSLHTTGFWNNTSAKISRITINCSPSTFAAGSYAIIEGRQIGS